MTAMKRHVLLSALALVLSIPRASAQWVEMPPADTDVTKPLTESYAAVRAGRTDGTVLQDQLAELLATPDATQALRWLAWHGEVLSRAQVNDLHAEFIRLNPSHEWTRSEKENLAREQFWNLPRRDRLRVYREVVGSGTLRVEDGFPLNRALALSAAAWEGMTELESELCAHGSELLASASAPLVPYSVWEMRLAKDAENRNEAIVLRAKRLDEMGERELFEAMKGDEAFRALVEQTASYDCSSQPGNTRDRETAVALGRACMHLQSVVRRQEQYVKRSALGREAVGGVRDAGLGSCIGLPTSWSERLAYAVRMWHPSP
jgi:hypothetical protein